MAILKSIQPYLSNVLPVDNILVCIPTRTYMHPSIPHTFSIRTYTSATQQSCTGGLYKSSKCLWCAIIGLALYYHHHYQLSMSCCNNEYLRMLGLKWLQFCWVTLLMWFCLVANYIWQYRKMYRAHWTVSRPCPHHLSNVQLFLHIQGS